MAACGGLEHIFEKPLPWKQPVDHHSFTEIFSQNENNYLLSSSLSPDSSHQLKRNDSVSSQNSECISTCTEEVVSDEDNSLNNYNYYNKPRKSGEYNNLEKYWCDSRRGSRKNVGTIPPPISCLGRNGKPWVFFKSIRKDGRFILKEFMLPTQEFLHSCRKNGRLKMQFIHSDDEIIDDEEDEDEDVSETEDVKVIGA